MSPPASTSGGDAKIDGRRCAIASAVTCSRLDVMKLSVPTIKPLFGRSSSLAIAGAMSEAAWIGEAVNEPLGDRVRHASEHYGNGAGCLPRGDQASGGTGNPAAVLLLQAATHR